MSEYTSISQEPWFIAYCEQQRLKMQVEGMLQFEELRSELGLPIDLPLDIGGRVVDGDVLNEEWGVAIRYEGGVPSKLIIIPALEGQSR